MIRKNSRQMNRYWENNILASHPHTIEKSFSIIDDIPTLSGYTLIYLLDASCSACIGNFIRFYSIVEKLEFPVNIITVFNDRYSEIYAYYTERLDNIQKIIKIPVLYEYPFGWNGDNNHVLLLSDGKLIKTLRQDEYGYLIFE